MDSDNKGTGSEQQSGLHSHTHLVHQQECMVGHCNAWTVSYCTLMDYATVSYWYICMSLTTSGELLDRGRIEDQKRVPPFGVKRMRAFCFKGLPCIFIPMMYDYEFQFDDVYSILSIVSCTPVGTTSL